VPRPAREIGGADKRPVDARRGQFKIIGCGDRFLHIHDGGHGAADDLAIVDTHRSVRLLGHDLHGATIHAGDTHPHEAIAELLDDGFDHARNPRGDAVLEDEPDILAAGIRLVGILVLHG